MTTTSAHDLPRLDGPITEAERWWGRTVTPLVERLRREYPACFAPQCPPVAAGAPAPVPEKAEEGVAA